MSSIFDLVVRNLVPLYFYFVLVDTFSDLQYV